MKKYKSNKLDSYEVYSVTNRDGVIIYIGSGHFGRHKHCKSGCSHVYELNRMHFSGEEVEVKILSSSLTKEQSLIVEKELILFNKPTLNTRFISNTDLQVNAYEAKLMKSKLLEIINGLDDHNQLLMKFSNQVIDFIDTYKMQGLIEGIRVKYNVVRPLKGNSSSFNREKYFNSIFEHKTQFLKLRDEIITKLYDKTN